MLKMRKLKKDSKKVKGEKKPPLPRALLNSFSLNMKVGAKLQGTIIFTVALVLGIITVVVTTSYKTSIIGDRKAIMQSRLDTIAKEIEMENEQVGSIVMTLALSVSQTGVGERIKALEYSKALLQRFPNLMGTYINYESNADGQDEQYDDRVLYTDNGRFIPYWYWQDPLAKDVLLLMPSEELETSEKYAGAREKWQQLRNTNTGEKNLLYFTEPFVNQDIPMISVSYPLIEEGEFIGIVGADRSLAMLTKALNEFKPFLSANVFLMSRSGDFVAATGEYVKKGLVGKNLKNSPELAKIFNKHFTSRKRGVVEIAESGGKESRYFVFSPVSVGGWMLAMEVNKSEIVAPVNKAVSFMVIFAAVSFIVLAGVIWGISRLIIVNPIRSIMNLFGEIGMGNFDARAEVIYQDEIGEMASSLNAMLDNTLVLIQSREERDAIQASIMRLLDEISGLAEGDLSRRAVVTAELTGAIADSFNAMAEQLSGVIKNVKQATGQVTTTTRKVNTSSTQLAKASELQARQVSQSKNAINEMAASIRQVANTAVQSAAVSKKSTVNAKEGAEAVQNTNKAMEEIRKNVQETSRSIKRLGESSQEIGNIVQLINDIADRTSILALNASIQAAMAGDAGRGFAVVAEEVQRLAERSTNATKQIDTLIKNIQGEINEAGSSMEESIQRVVEGSTLAGNAHQKLQQIEAVSNQLAELIQSISIAATQQTKSSDDITNTMEKMGAVSSKNLAASRQTTRAINQLAATSNELAASVEAFKLEEEILTMPSKDRQQKIKSVSLKEAPKVQERSETSLLDLV
jgi:twitching motility protein PilJ